MALVRYSPGTECPTDALAGIASTAREPRDSATRAAVGEPRTRRRARCGGPAESNPARSERSEREERRPRLRSQYGECAMRDRRIVRSSTSSRALQRRSLIVSYDREIC